MNLPSWNARGLESLRAFRAVSDLIRSKNSSIMFFSTKSGEEVANQIKIMGNFRGFFKSKWFHKKAPLRKEQYETKRRQMQTVNDSRILLS